LFNALPESLLARLLAASGGKAPKCIRQGTVGVIAGAAEMIEVRHFMCENPALDMRRFVPELNAEKNLIAIRVSHTTNLGNCSV